jgi:hypothetical protein
MGECAQTATRTAINLRMDELHPTTFIVPVNYTMSHCSPFRRGDTVKDEGVMKIAAFFTGVGIGTAVGIFVAQQSGNDTKRQVSDSVEKGKKFVSDKMVDTVSRVADAAHDKIEDLADRLSPLDAAEPQSVAFPGLEAQAS